MRLRWGKARLEAPEHFRTDGVRSSGYSGIEQTQGIEGGVFRLSVASQNRLDDTDFMHSREIVFFLRLMTQLCDQITSHHTCCREHESTSIMSPTAATLCTSGLTSLVSNLHFLRLRLIGLMFCSVLTHLVGLARVETLEVLALELLRPSSSCGQAIVRSSPMLVLYHWVGRHQRQHKES